MSNTKSITEALVIVDMQADFLDRMDDEYLNDEAGIVCDAAAARKKLMKGVLREVKEAKRKRLPIVCLQYANQEDGFDSPRSSWAYHATDAAIRKALKGYSRAYFAWKDSDSGADEVMDLLEGVEPRLGMDTLTYKGKPNEIRKFITDKRKMIDFTVVGVNADACVAATCDGLVSMCHKCRVPADAAMNVWDCSFADESDELDFLAGVRVIRQKRKALAA